MGDKCSPDTPDECCGYKIAAGISKPVLAADTDAGERCSSTKTAPCVMPPAKNDPCAENPCKNAASCSAEYATVAGRCELIASCDCSAVKGKVLYGQYCESSCPSNCTACGRGYGLYGDAQRKTLDRYKFVDNFAYITRCAVPL
jgi:hypothetical protein